MAHIIECIEMSNNTKISRDVQSMKCSSCIAAADMTPAMNAQRSEGCNQESNTTDPPSDRKSVV